jgi:hypothetical protein
MAGKMPPLDRRAGRLACRKRYGNSVARWLLKDRVEQKRLFLTGRRNGIAVHIEAGFRSLALR